MLHPNQVTMDDFQAVESCVFNLESDPDMEFYDSGSDKEFLEKHSVDLWGKCTCKETQSFTLLTPPTSPQHDSFSDTPVPETFLDGVVNCVDDESLTRTILDGSNDIFSDIKLDSDMDTLAANLIQDCMWSGPCLTAAGFGVLTVSSNKSRSVDVNSNTIVDKKSHLDISSTDCVDPAVVFPVTSRNNSPVPRLSLSISEGDVYTGLETPSASESDDEEIDVVGVADKFCRANRHGSPALSSSKRPTVRVMKNELGTILQANLPATTSMSAQVAALHNYSSTTPSVKSHSCLHKSLSAPHTPSSSSQLKRSRPFASSPTSPQLCKKQRLAAPERHRVIATERDLHSVVRKLNSSGRKPKCSEALSYSRSSSDNEDVSENGKRAYHNVLERKRRDDLRHSFHMLRCAVPHIKDNERAPKMVVLNTSTEYVLELTRQHQSLNAELQRQKLIQEQLKRKLSHLRREAAF